MNLKKVLKILGYGLLLLFGVVLLSVILVNTAPVQNLLAQKAVEILSGKLKTKVSVQNVRFHLLNYASLEGLYIEDQKGDTLLFAGKADIRISNWFIFKDKPVISTVNLTNAKVWMHRPKTSNLWNFQFILDAFSPSKKPEKKSSSTISLDLKQTRLVNVQFQMQDEWIGSDMGGSIGNFFLEANRVDVKNKVIDLRFIKGDQLVFGMTEYTGGRPSRPKSIEESPIDTTAFNPHMWKVSLAKLELTNNRFFLEYPETNAPEGLFDEDHLNITGIQVQARDLLIQGDTITANLTNLQARERCGLTIKKMSAQLKVSPNISECKNLYLQTENSILRDYYAMVYERFPDFTDYIQKVKMIGDLKDAEIGIRDIVYFAPQLANYQNLSVKISGKGNGTVARLTAKDVELNDGFSTLKGSMSMVGLPDIYSTFMDFRNLELNSSGQAAMFYAPGLRTQTIANFQAIKQFRFKGNFTGFISDFVAFGDFRTNLGQLHADVNMKLPANNLPSYSGSLKGVQFDLGTFFYQKNIGNISFAADLKGKGFAQKDVDFNVDGRISEFDVNDYNYSNIRVNGQLKKKQFDGNLKVDDPNLILDFTGNVDWSADRPVYDFFADVDFVDAYKLHLLQDHVKGKFSMKSNFTGKNIDDFIGSALVYNVNLTRDSSKLNIDSLQLVSRINSNYDKELILTSNSFFAQVYGQFNLMLLPQSFQLFLSYYLPEYIATPSRFDVQQNLKFEIKANQDNDLVSLLHRDIQVGDSTHITGSLDMAEQQLLVKGRFPTFRFNKLLVNNVLLDVSGNYQGMDLNLNTENVTGGGEDLVSKLNFATHISQDSASFKLLSSSLDNNIENAQLNGIAYAFRDSFFVQILPSEFYLSKNHWVIPKGNKFIFSKNNFIVDNLNLRSGNQLISINAPPHKSGSNEAFVKIENLELIPLNDFLNWKDFKLDGKVDGNVQIKGISSQANFDFALYSTMVKINQDTIGAIKAKGNFNWNQKQLNLEKGTGIRYKDASADLVLGINFSDTANEGVNGQIQLKDAQVSWAQPFMLGLVHDLSGTMNGDLNISGPLSKFQAGGRIKITNSGFTPDIIGAHYTIRNGFVNVIPEGFQIENITVFDDYDNTASISGTIFHQQLSNFRFSIRFSSDQLQVVNLKAKESERFYGNIFASFQAQLTGPFENLNMTVFATPKKNSNLVIPISFDSDLGSYNFIHFKNTKKDSVVFQPGIRNKINFRLDAIATPDLQMTILLDENAGDRIVAKGNGNVILEIPSDDEMRMNGNYVIESGTYDFSFKQLQVLNYKKQFTINPNSSIKWNGDIKDADLDVSAYATIKARLYDLISSEVDRLNLSPSEIKDVQIPQNVNVLLKMKGLLSNPDMKFNIELTEGRSIGTYAYQRLQRINADDKELLNQVASLLLLDRFMPPEGINNAAISSGTINNMSELLASALSSQITNFANKAFGMSDLTVGLTYKNYALSNSGSITNLDYFNRNEAGVNLRKNFFNNRLTVELGGVYDWGRTAGSNNFQDNLAGDFRVQYLLTEEGRIRLEVFRNSNFDALALQNISRQGIGLNYRKSFNGFYDFFNLKHRFKKVDSTIIPKLSPQIKEIKEADSLDSRSMNR